MKPEIQAYWISPSGKAIEVESLHITTVLENPSKFGYTKAKLKKFFDKHNEDFSTTHEGYAREDIMIEMLKKGWVRVRYLIRQDTWTIQTAKLKNSTKNIIFSFVAKMLKKKLMAKYTGVRVITDLNGSELLGDVEEIIDFSIFESNNIDRPCDTNVLVEIVTINEFKYSIDDVLA